MTNSSTCRDWQAELGLDRTPSAYQSAILDFVDHGEGNGMAVAVAGSGKSTCLAWATRIACNQGYVLALAFNVEAKDALTEKLEGTSARVKTVHGHGYCALGFTFGWANIKVEENKYSDLVDRYIAEFDAAQTLAGDDCSPPEVKAIIDGGFPRAGILKLLELARLELLDAFANDFGGCLRALAMHHNVDVDPALGQLVTDVVRLAMKWGANNPRILDFCDMVWLPTVLRLRPWTADWVFVDEAQDISKAHRALIRASVKRGGRALFVADPKQAIYGFAGADAESFQAILDEFECTLIPLSVCYRCPTKVLDLAREIVPQIEAAPGAPEGVVRNSTTDAFIAEAERGDMVLCRLNAPLLSIAFKLIGAGTSAAVRGRRDLGEGLAKVIDRCTSRRSFEDFGNALDDWEEKEKDHARKRYGKRSEDALLARLEAIADQAECIRVIWGSSGANSARALKAAIDRLFADKDPKVVLSSIHRAKGLEARRVFVAKPERLGQAWPNSQQWMIDQEKHLEYVCITRAMSELVFLDGEAPKPEPRDDKSTPQLQPARAPEWKAPAALPPVDAGAPDTYDASSPAARVALARRLDKALREQGFQPARVLQVAETVYVRPAGELVCRVYSTIVGREVRGLGKDAIRVCIVDERGVQARGASKARRVNRVGKIDEIIRRVQGRVDALQGRAS